MSSDPAALLHKHVKIHSVSVKPELNNKIGVVQSYLPERSRYLVSFPPHISPAPIAFKADNLAIPTFAEKARGKIDEFWGMVMTIYHDQNLRQELRRGLVSIQSKLPPNVKIEHVAVGILLLIFGVIYMLGLSKTIMLVSLVSMMFVVALPDVVARRDAVSIVKNFPSRWKEAIEQNTGYRLSLRTATGILIAILILSSKVLLTPQSYSRRLDKYGSDDLSYKGDKINLPSDVVSFTMEEVYRLGYQDGQNKDNFGESLPKNHASMSFRSLDSGFKYDDAYYNHDYLAPPTPKKSKFGLGTMISLFALGKTIKELGFVQGRFDWNILVTNVRNLPPMRMALLAFMAYRVVSAII